ncbi:Nramp family divalent metal transporter [bacterium]|nr:Nramp family divalent metal transporter [bacterium]MCI0601461.1 Nramp family divalent metal transporter [bacterium]
MNGPVTSLKNIEIKSEVPPPLAFKRFMVWIGPVMMALALGLGASEVILYPNLTARFGPGWFGLMLLTLFFQTIWAQELARWTVVAAEHAAQAGARIVTFTGSIISISLFMFLAFAIPTWATSAASALRELVGWPADLRTGTVFWSYVTFLFVFVLAFFSRVARSLVERIALWSTVAAWLILIVAAFLGIQSSTVERMLHHVLVWDIPEQMDWWVLGSTLAWAGAGPTLTWYTYWMRDAGWGMAGYVPPLPGWFGQSTKPETGGFVAELNQTNIARLKVWIKRSHLILWIAYFGGSALTIFIFVGLSDSILRPQGLVPSGFDIVKHQAQFFSVPLGRAGYVLFLIMAWLLFFNTQITVAEALIRQNADVTSTFFSRRRKSVQPDVKRIYFWWWVIYLLISFVLIGAQYLVEGWNPFAFATGSAMLSFVSMIVSMGTTLVGSIVLYRHGILRHVRPHAVTIFLLFAGFVLYLYLIVRAVAYY